MTDSQLAALIFAAAPLALALIFLSHAAFQAFDRAAAKRPLATGALLLAPLSAGCALLAVLS